MRESRACKNEMTVQSREGLNIGLAVTVRYRLDPNKLASVQAHLPQPADKELVPPVVASAWRQLAPSYTVREIFSTQARRSAERGGGNHHEEAGGGRHRGGRSDAGGHPVAGAVREGAGRAAAEGTGGRPDGVDTDIQQKQVRIAELQAEAEAKQKEKQAEGDAQSKVIEAKGEADAMQYTLPLKQKQIEQSKLEAEARKEATIQNAQADAEAKVIDSKAELQRRNLLADAEASRIKLIAAANAERMTSEAALLNKSPLLINKIVAERLSDKIQVVMVPSDGKFFFANDVFKNMANAPMVKQEMDSESEPEPKSGH